MTAISLESIMTILNRTIEVAVVVLFATLLYLVFVP